MNLRWIIDDIGEILAEFKRPQTWLIIGLIAFFGWLTYLVAIYAFRTDAILIFLHRTAGSCRELTNGIIIFLFCGMIFFMLTALLMLGEFQRYFEYKEHHAHVQAQKALWWGIGWTCASVAIVVSALVFFDRFCR